MNPIRPGVYTSYTLTPLLTPATGGPIGVVAAGGGNNKAHRLTSLMQAKAVFGEAETTLLQLLRAVFAHANVVVYAASTTSDAPSALNAVLSEPISLLCTDLTAQSDLLTLRDTLQQKARAGEPIVAIAGCTSPTTAKSLASALNCERICLTLPAVTAEGGINVAPAILAGLIAASDAVTDNLNGALANTVYRTALSYPEDELRDLMQVGLCLFQQSGSFAELLRGRTTKTTHADGAPDHRFQNLSVVLTADRIVTSVRQLLQQKLLTQPGGRVTLDAVLALVVCLLEDAVSERALTSYDAPRIYLDPEDRTLCHVDLGFTVQQGIYQVYLHALVTA